MAAWRVVLGIVVLACQVERPGWREGWSRDNWNRLMLPRSVDSDLSHFL